MALLLDSHALLWWLFEPAAMSVASRDALARDDDSVWVSAASAWEIAIKHAKGKLPQAATLLANWHELLRAQNFSELPVVAEQALRAGALPRHHEDPFDRMLIAQALGANLTLLSADREFDAYGVRRLW